MLNRNLENLNKDLIDAVLSYKGDDRLIRELLAQKADINYKDEHGHTPLQLAATAILDKSNLIHLFVKEGAEINGGNMTALGLAILFSKVKAVRALIEEGANINSYTRSGACPRVLAARVEAEARHKHENVDAANTICDIIDEAIKREEAEEKIRIEMRSAFQFFSEKRLAYQERPQVFMPNVLVDIIDDYLKPASVFTNKKT